MADIILPKSNTILTYFVNKRFLNYSALSIYIYKLYIFLYSIFHIFSHIPIHPPPPHYWHHNYYHETSQYTHNYTATSNSSHSILHSSFSLISSRLIKPITRTFWTFIAFIHKFVIVIKKTTKQKAQQHQLYSLPTK